MRRLAKSNKLNKGFSLIEVLVAMAVITLISIPLLRTFITSAQINTKAKKLQNATDIAQNVSENFITIPLVTLKQDNQDDTSICGEYLLDEDKDIIVFKNIGDGSVDENDVPYFKGNDGEKFYVTVTMNPDEYSKETDIVGVQDINNYIAPSMGDLFASNVVTAYSQFTKYDNRILTAFENMFPEVDIFATDEFYYDDIKKTTYVNIEQMKDGDYINYIYRMTVRYTYCTSHVTEYVESNYYIDYNFTLAEGRISGAEAMPELFLLYTPFDRYDTSCPYTYARDEIHIDYMMNDSVIQSVVPDWERETKVYIVEQNVTNGLHKKNIILAHHKQYPATAANNYGAGSSNPNLEIYSTISDWNQNVTAGRDQLLELYEVNVYVWHNMPDPNDIGDYADGTFDQNAVYTSVEAIKEEQPKKEDS